MAGRSDEFDALFKGPMIRSRSTERRQERVVNVDDPLRVTIHKMAAQNLHIPSQNDEVNLILLQECELPLLSLKLVVFHGDEMKRDLIELSQLPSSLVVADNQWEFTVQFSAALSVKKIGKAMIIV